MWTPAILILDESGVERVRLEGYLPLQEISAQIEMALGRIAFVQKRFIEAERIYAQVTQDHPATAAAPEALYWSAVSHYKNSRDHDFLASFGRQLSEKYPGTIWAARGSVWQH